MLTFLLGLGIGTAMGATASTEIKALAYRLYSTARIWCTKPPLE